MQIDVKLNTEQVARELGVAVRQVRFAAAVALTRTAKDVQRVMPAQLAQDLDKPTAFTTKGTFVRSARRDTLVSAVGFKDAQSKYMQYQVEGGVYKPPAAGIRLPGNVQLNAFGNIPRGLVSKLKAAARDGSLGKAVAKRLNAAGNRRKGAAPIQLFYGQPRGARWRDAPVGIWRRIPPSTPGGVGKLVPVILFEDTPAQYEQIFDFEGLARKVVQQNIQQNFDRALREALASAN